MMKRDATNQRTPLPLLAATTAITGALIMVVEVMGSRVIGPFFGVSLFVWTALITVTLLALATGYAAGGWLADRNSSPDTLYFLVLLAGITAIAIPWIKSPVLATSGHFGLRTGALVASVVLFGPTLLLLGCVSPFVVRLAAPSIERMGRTVGLLYALSTIGSFIGTVTTGFFLIAWLGVRSTFLLTGSLLIALAVAWFVIMRRRWGTLLLIALPAILPAEPQFVAAKMPNGTEVRRIQRKESYYADLQVLDYTGSLFRTRELVLDGLVQGGIDRDTGQSVYEYPYHLEHLALGFRPHGSSCLVIGLGAGVVPRWFEARGIDCDVVDINPDVVAAAQDYFGFTPRGRVVISDARRYLIEDAHRYDYVVLDVFTGDTTPGHLLTVEALRAISDHVAPGGVVVANLICDTRPQAASTRSIVRTASEVFNQALVFSTFDVSSGPSFGNFVLVAHDGPLRRPDLERIPIDQVHPLARRGVLTYMGRVHELGGLSGATVLSDDFNPLDFLDRGVKERLRWELLSGVDWRTLL